MLMIVYYGNSSIYTTSLTDINNIAFAAYFYKRQNKE